MQEARAAEEAHAVAALLRETKEELLLTISLYNERLYRHEKYTKRFASIFWWNLLIMCFTYYCIENGFILFLFISSLICCVVCFLVFMLCTFHNIFFLEDVPLLQDPEGAASYHLAKCRKNRPINTELLRNPSNEWIEGLYKTFITEDVHHERDLVKILLKEAALRALMIDRIDHCCVPIHSPQYSDYDEEDEEEDE